MILETDFEGLNLIVKLDKDPEYRPCDRMAPHSRKDLKKLDKGLLSSYQVVIEVKKDEEEMTVFFPTILLPNIDDEDELLDSFELDFQEVLLPMLVDYLEKVKFLS